MPKLQTIMGMQGFKWFIGKVEDVNDPLQIGRLRVRAFMVHTEDSSILPSDLLPWSFVSQDITSAANEGIGTSPTGATVGTMVWGFYLDGDHAQMPMVCGTIAGMPNGTSDVSTLVSGNKVVKTLLPDEPESTASPVYPHNKVVTTKSGHVVEIDDTIGKERIHVFHKSGSYIEMTSVGDMIIKATGNSVVVGGGDHFTRVAGNITKTTEKDVVFTSENLSCNTSNSLKLNGTNIDIEGKSNINLKVGDSIVSITSNKIELKSSGSFITIEKGRITLKGGSTTII